MHFHTQDGYFFSKTAQNASPKTWWSMGKSLQNSFSIFFSFKPSWPWKKTLKSFFLFCFLTAGFGFLCNISQISNSGNFGDQNTVCVAEFCGHLLKAFEKSFRSLGNMAGEQLNLKVAITVRTKIGDFEWWPSLYGHPSKALGESFCLMRHMNCAISQANISNFESEDLQT